jgi:hypothetical protein
MLDVFDDAKELFAKFQDHQQEEWEQKAVKGTPQETKQDTANKRHFLVEIVLWYLRLVHFEWEMTKHLPDNARGVPDFLRSFNTAEV